MLYGDLLNANSRWQNAKKTLLSMEKLGKKQANATDVINLLHAIHLSRSKLELKKALIEQIINDIIEK